jgi:hypothetical protein
MRADNHHNKVDPRFTRRTMLLATGVAITGPRLTPAAALEDSKPEPATHQPTYRETEHIRTFYDRSRF